MVENHNSDHIDATSSIPIVESFSGPQSVFDINSADIPTGSAVLVVVKGPQIGDAFVLNPTGNEIGRGEGSDLLLDDVTVSRNHASLWHGDNGWMIKDLNSLNGTYVNRNRISEIMLSGGEELQIGKYRFAFLLPTAGQ